MQTAQQQQLAPRTIKLETPHFVVRTLETADIDPRWQEWLKDPATARNLNARPETMTEQQLQTYVQNFNRTTAHLLGIFEKDTGRLIGVRAIYIDPKRSEFLVNVLVGEKEDRNKGARKESRDVMYRYFFKEMDLQSARCAVVSTNAPVLKVMDDNGWIHEHTEHKTAADGQGFIELRHFRLTREVWQQREDEKGLTPQ